MKFLVSCTHASPDYRLSGVAFTDDYSTPFAVNDGRDGLFFADTGPHGCGKSYATPEAAIRGLLLDNGCTNIVIEEAGKIEAGEVYGVKLTKRDGSARPWYAGTLVGFCDKGDWSRLIPFTATMQGAEAKAAEMQAVADQRSEDILYVACALPVASFEAPAPTHSNPYEKCPAYLAMIEEKAARIALEDRIVRAVVEDAIAAGHSVSVHNGGDEPEIAKSKDVGAVLAVMHSTDEERIDIHLECGPRAGWNALVFFVYGNGGCNVIADASSFAAPFLDRAEKIAEEALAAEDAADAQAEDSGDIGDEPLTDQEIAAALSPADVLSELLANRGDDCLHVDDRRMIAAALSKAKIAAPAPVAHTPAKISAVPASRVGHYNLFVLDGDEPHMIGTLVPGSARRAEQIKKDLSLMTAAPDLLAALKQAIIGVGPERPWYEAACAAIGKATA